ncbi:MAG: hypothetical protein U0V72_01405 [Cytophagales bacterium]
MFNFIAKAWGVVTLICAVICLLPFLGWGNWLIIIMAIVGCIISAFSEGRNGMMLNIVALILAFFRLIVGGGII